MLDNGYEDVLSLRNGERCFKQLEYEGNRYLTAMVASTGYREYKRNDHYRNDVIAITCLPYHLIDSGLKIPQRTAGRLARCVPLAYNRRRLFRASILSIVVQGHRSSRGHAQGWQ
ncbi:hypothetical protein HSBAA_57930 [Vreelandella sulfidaeris]|uniref:Uncharacterized protein n=1 Tax=Vreelandella sulfidaeris TaxID=115553 RepID=A0A455UFM9_9GAMM|nr:hypothetical protein HSBAA_57930 [Halomonas sulfidaeris]